MNYRLSSRAILLGLIFAALAGPTRSVAQVSLVTVVDLAQRNSTAVRIAQADVDKAQALLAENKDVIIPSLTFSTGLPAFPETGFTGTPPSVWGATVQSLVFSVSQKRYLDAARLGLRAAFTSLKDAREQVALDASSSYIELDTIKQDLQAARQQEEFAQRLVIIEQQRAEAGVDPLSELLQTRLTAAQVKLRRQQLEARAGTLTTQLAGLTGLPAESIAPVHDSIPAVPKITAGAAPPAHSGLEAAQLLARSKQLVAKGDEEIEGKGERTKKNRERSPAYTKESKMEQLQKELTEAISREDYERAAKLRDEIRRLQLGD